MAARTCEAATKRDTEMPDYQFLRVILMIQSCMDRQNCSYLKTGEFGLARVAPTK